MSKKVGTIVDCLPVGNNLVIEVLDDAEAMGTSLHLQTNKRTDKQAYVVAAGPKLDSSYGISVGDRILINSVAGATEVPNYKDNERKQYIVDPSSVKCVLKEKK